MKPSVFFVALSFVTAAVAQSPAPRAESTDAPDATALAAFGWLEGCWRGTVNQREYREHWMPLRGGLLIGVSQTVGQGKTQGYEYLRVEPRAEGIYYVAAPSGKNETAFKFTEKTVDRGDEIFTFVNPRPEFPQTITYRRASEGWLYATVAGKIDGTDKEVIYPMRRIGCESGEYLLR